MAWPDIFQISHSKASAERATRRYLEDINSASCLIHLDKALGQLLDGVKDAEKTFSNYATTDPSGKLMWNRDSFARYIDARLPENPTVAICVPLLWCTFSIGAFLGTVKRTRNRYQSEPSQMAGLFPQSQKGFTPIKVPRLARIVFRSLSTPWPQSGTQSQDPQELLQLQDIKDTIAFTQPIINEDIRYGRATVADGEFEAAAYRLLLADSKQLTVRGSCIAVSKADLQILIQLFLLQRVEDRRWRAGLSYRNMYQRSGDIMFSRLISDPDEVSRASELVSAFLAYQFPGTDDYMTWEQFKAFCLEVPSFIFSFFQLWATIFTPTTVPQALRDKGKSSLLIGTTNILSFLNVGHFLSGKLPDYRFRQNESLFQLDLQAFTLVANLATTPELSVGKLHNIIAAQDWFHVMLIRGEDLKVEGRSSSRLIVAFTSPPEKEMWRPERKRSMQYFWRTSVIQFEPDLAVADSGGMSASVMGEVLKLRSHGGGEEDTMKVDLAGKTVNVTLGTGLAEKAESKNVELSEATSTLVIRLTDLKCYRMPGMSSKITSSG
ncbi:hypothetical protein N7501_002923 [Penicillium viridicatum]|nr:hypothetical protein N7501_002923 [Penicillium viridicatum]